MGFSITPDSGTSLRKMLKFNLEPHMEQFEAISAGASKEHSLEKAMQKMEDDWDPIIFNTTLYRDTGKPGESIIAICTKILSLSLSLPSLSALPPQECPS